MGYMNASKAIFPHGIFEIIAMIIAASYGLQLGKVFHRWLKQKNVISLKQSTAKAVKINVMIGIPLLVIAAFIETYVTPYLYSRIP